MTANVRFIFDNAGDRATLSASSAAIAAANLQTDERAAVWRTAAAVTSATLTANWATAEPIDSIALAWTNLSTVATMRVRGYTLPNDAAAAFDSTINVCPQTLGDLHWGLEPLGGGGAWRTSSPMAAAVWLTGPYAIRKLTIDLVDIYATGGYLEASRLITGLRFEPAVNAVYPWNVKAVDRARPARAESGDLRVETLTRYRSFTLDLARLAVTDERNKLMRMAQRGLARGVFVSVAPDWSDTSDVQLGSFYAGLASEPELGMTFIDNWRTNLTFEEMA